LGEWQVDAGVKRKIRRRGNEDNASLVEENFMSTSTVIESGNHPDRLGLVQSVNKNEAGKK